MGRRFASMVILGCAFSVAPLSAGADEDGATSTLVANSIRAVARWTVLESDQSPVELLCVIAGVDGELRSLRVFDARRPKSPIFEKEESSVPIAVFPSTEVGGRLITIWMGGVSYHVLIFAFSEGKVLQVFESGARVMPEVIDQGRFVVLSDIDPTKSPPAPSTSRVYEWTGSDYRLVRKAPWTERFQAVRPVRDDGPAKSQFK